MRRMVKGIVIDACGEGDDECDKRCLFQHVYGKVCRHARKTEKGVIVNLRNKTIVGGENRGFTKRHNEIFTYSQQRNGLTYLYAKRRVLEDGVSTKSLLI
jgi:hypothetical protein